MVYAGSFVTVNCSIQLNSAVDSQVTVSTTWRNNDTTLTDSSNRVISNAAMIGNTSVYLTQIEFRPFQLGAYDGVYSCEVTIDAEMDEFITSTGLRSDNVSLRAAGNFLFIP